VGSRFGGFRFAAGLSLQSGLPAAAAGTAPLLPTVATPAASRSVPSYRSSPSYGGGSGYRSAPTYRAAPSFGGNSGGSRGMPSYRSPRHPAAAGIAPLLPREGTLEVVVAAVPAARKFPRRAPLTPTDGSVCPTLARKSLSFCWDKALSPAGGGRD